MQLQGAVAERKTLRWASNLFSELNLCALKWIRQGDGGSAAKVLVLFAIGLHFAIVISGFFVGSHTGLSVFRPGKPAFYN